MHEFTKKRLELLQELDNFFQKSSIKYYVSGNILINIYNNLEINENVSFDLNVLNKKIKSMKLLNSKDRVVKEFFDKNGILKYYKYINKNTLYYDCNDFKDNEDEKGIYIKIYLNSKDYKSYKNIKINKINFTVPENLDEILEEQFGLGYKYIKEKALPLPKNIVYSTKISYKQYFDYLKKNDYKINKDIYYDLEKSLEAEEEYRKIVDNYRNLVFRTDVRFKLLKNYENKKEEIIRLHSKKDYKKLSLILFDYLFEIKRLYDLGLALSFDKEIFDITIDYLKYDNQKKLADFLLNNTPKEHLKNIDFTYNDKGVENEDQFIDLKKKHIELLSRFDDYCKKYNIEYFGNGGTVLGAIRHGGLIPWDDDIDVTMTYDAYNKFIKIIKKHPMEGLKFVCIENTPNYTINFGRLYDLSSFRMYYTDSLLTSSYGFHLDIFVLDDYIEDAKKRK